MLRPMVISLLAIDTLTKSPIVILKERNGERILPMWIGVLEANAISRALSGITSVRPMTHELLTNIIEMAGITVSRVEICGLKDYTYYAIVYLNDGGKEIIIDARPSDALALALRVGAPILVADEVIEQSKPAEVQAGLKHSSKQGDKWKELLETLDEKDFGNT
jgi:bifunctional DNase/RNase